MVRIIFFLRKETCKEFRRRNCLWYQGERLNRAQMDGCCRSGSGCLRCWWPRLVGGRLLFPELSRGCKLAISTSDEDEAVLAESARQLASSVCGSANGTQLGRWEHAAGGETTIYCGIYCGSYLSKSLAQCARLYCLGWGPGSPEKALGALLAFVKLFCLDLRLFSSYFSEQAAWTSRCPSVSCLELLGCGGGFEQHPFVKWVFAEVILWIEPSIAACGEGWCSPVGLWPPPVLPCCSGGLLQCCTPPQTCGAPPMGNGESWQKY